TSNNNAGDLGDYYQWGRVADGHQNIVWSKDATHVNQWKPSIGEGNTSAIIYYNNCYEGFSNCTPIFPVYNNETHQVEENTYYYGKFIYSWTDYINMHRPNLNGDKDWYFECGDANDVQTCYHNDGLWGVAAGRNRAAQGSLSFEWNIPANNPCPSGWRIPSVWNWWDIISGNGSDEPSPDSDLFVFPLVNYGSATNNNWQRRHASSNNNAYGGVIITNITNEKIFLPWIGLRDMYEDCPQSPETNGVYWSSTGFNTSGVNANIYSYLLYMGTTYSYLGGGGYERERGLCVRCVKE
ncbi:MAG: hypothetical protein LBS50_05850, partial [Prevotellaceae bacterium]|nr:hypothetical protein [Prevotellaceae bacterium]